MIKITNKSDSALIQIFGDIGESFFTQGWTLEKFQNQIKGLEVSNLTIEMKSNGGDLLEAFAIYDTIRKLPARVTVDIIGASASAATIIASGGDKVRISENSRYLIHNARTDVEGNKEDLKDYYEQLASFDNQILDIYVKRTGQPKNVLAEIMKQEKWITAEEAKQLGFVDEIIKHKIENKMDKNLFTAAEQEEMDALLAENEELKATIAELEAKLAELEGEKEIAVEEEATAKIENAIATGKLKAEQKKAWINLYKIDKTATVDAIDAIHVTKLANVIDSKAPVTGSMTKDQLLKNWRSNVYKNNSAQYAKDYEEVYGKKPKI